MKRRALRALAAAAPLLLAVPVLRHALESRMALHMLIEFPLLLAGGVSVAPWLAARWPRGGRAFERIDALGLLGATWLLAVSALWMIPAALDLALLDARVGAFKLASWWLAGLLFAWSAARLSTTLLAFALGNLAWMAASAGLLYQSLETRLCVSYLQDEQVWTGRGLVALSIALLAWLVVRIARAQRSRSAIQAGNPSTTKQAAPTT